MLGTCFSRASPGTQRPQPKLLFLADSELEGAGSNPGGTGGGSDALVALVWHPTDGAMKPIVGNKRIERPMEAAYAPALLPFKPLASPRWAGCLYWIGCRCLALAIKQSFPAPFMGSGGDSGTLGGKAAAPL
jgi:hypothetical protein